MVHGHGEGRVDLIIGNVLGGSWVSLGGSWASFLGEVELFGGGGLPMRPPPP